MLNYTKYIRRLTVCADARMKELLDARNIEEADECWKLCSGWIAGAELVAVCITDSTLRDELDEMLEEFRRVMNATHSMMLTRLGGESS